LIPLELVKAKVLLQSFLEVDPVHAHTLRDYSEST
jgi:hypothetical protein